jgi:hypothetical protein
VGSADVGFDLFNIAQHLFDQQDKDKLEEAKVLGARALVIFEDTLGKDDPNYNNCEGFLDFVSTL